jgi:ATP-dependent Zn protease
MRSCTVFFTAEPVSLAIGVDGGVTESAIGALRATTRAHLERFLVALLGGRAAEQVAFGEVTAGSAGSPQSDLARANRLALRLEAQYGFGDLGLISLSDEPTDEDLLRYDWLRHSVRATIDRAYAAAVEALERNRVVLDALALALFEAGYLDRDEIERVLSPFMFDHGPVDENSISSRTGPAALPTTEPASAGVTLSFPDNLETPS